MMVWTFLIVGAIWVFSQFVPPLQAIVYQLYERNASGATGSVFWICLVAFALAQALLNARLHLLVRAALLVLVAAALYLCIVVNRDWTSGWVPAVVAALLIIWQGFTRFRPVMLLVGGALALSQAISALKSMF